MIAPVLKCYSEPFGSAGNIGVGLKRALGAPPLSPLHTLLREAVQNMADAAKLGTGPDILIRLRTLSAEQKTFLTQRILNDIPSDADSAAALNLAGDVRVLELCDFGTVGLGGPTRADRIPAANARREFINFLRNVGAGRESFSGGGTYGFGKVALYRASQCSTILVDSLSSEGGPGARRFIGCRLGAEFDVPNGSNLQPFTGRHWWGVPDPGDGFVDPALDDEAAALAEGLGLPDRNAASNGTGTSIMLLDFSLAGEDPGSFGRRVAEALLWNFWPRMMEDTPSTRRFSVKLEVDGKSFVVPKPEETAPLDILCSAMRSLRDPSGRSNVTIESQKPKKLLGRLAMEKGLRGKRTLITPDDERLFPDPLRHVALMRPVELVVKYLECPALPDAALEWGGVFVASSEKEVERAFALSEPPAHDEWNPDQLDDRTSKTFVKVALREVKSKASEFAVPGGLAVNQSQGGASLAKVAGRLGAALSGTVGDGAGETTSGGGGSKGGAGKPRLARVSRPVFQRLELKGGRKIAVFTADVIQNKERSGLRLKAKALVVMDGEGIDFSTRPSDEIPAKFRLFPRVVAIRDMDGQTVDEGSLELDGREGGIEIDVDMPIDCAVTVQALVEGNAGT